LIKKQENSGIFFFTIRAVYDIIFAKHILRRRKNMTEITQKEIKNVQEILKKERVFTLERLMSLLKCSRRTAQTRLKHWKVYTSYNQNGRYYTMPQIPNFDVNGLWHYENKFFSRHGNLKKTVIYLIRHCDSGLSGEQLGKLLGLLPRSFLHHFTDIPGIQREKKDGLYVYFSDDPNKYKQQVQKHMTIITSTSTSTEESLSDADAVLLLTALIKHHKISISIEDIMELPQIKERKFQIPVIEQFLQRHGLLDVKKTPITKP
jgi:hypothetical protein